MTRKMDAKRAGCENSTTFFTVLLYTILLIRYIRFCLYDHAAIPIITSTCLKRYQGRPIV